MKLLSTKFALRAGTCIGAAIDNIPNLIKAWWFIEFKPHKLYSNDIFTMFQNICFVLDHLKKKILTRVPYRKY